MFTVVCNDDSGVPTRLNGELTVCERLRQHVTLKLLSPLSYVDSLAGRARLCFFLRKEMHSRILITDPLSGVPPNLPEGICLKSEGMVAIVRDLIEWMKF